MADINPPSLHTHTYFSTLDGVPSPEKYLKKADELGINAIAFTDHGNLGSWAEATIEGQKFKAKTILGLEAYVTPSIKNLNIARNLSKGKGEKADEMKAYLKKVRSAFHLVLLAKNKIGYENIIAVNNRAWTEGFYFRPRTDLFDVIEHKEGVIALSACQAGIISRHLLNGNLKEAEAIARKMKKAFSNDFYLELQLLDMEEQHRLNKMLVSLGQKLKIPFVLTNDCHYINKEDHALQKALIELSTKGSFEMETQTNFLKTLSDFDLDFKKQTSIPKKIYLQAIENCFKIAESCNYTVPLGGLFFPEYDHTKHFLYSKFPIANKEDFFKKIIIYRANKTLGNLLKKEEYKERLFRELKVFKALGGLDYMLIVDDLLNFVRNSGAFSLIRGSANGSLIAYVFQFGLIDPIKHGIMFERFISEHRSLNDIDIDIDIRSEFRPKAVEYLRSLYGKDRVIPVGTYGRMQLKGAIKDITRVLKVRLDEEISKESDPEKIETLEEIRSQYLFPIINKITSPMEGNLPISRARKEYPAFDTWYEKNEEIIKTLIEPIIGNVKNVSLHPAGVVIIPDSVKNLLPIRTQPDPHDKDNRVASTVWENSHTSREDLNEFGVMILDVLGVKTLSVVSEVISAIKKQGKTFDLYNLRLDDKKTFEAFNNQELVGVFQFSGKSASQIIKSLTVTDFNDLIVINALARPGALTANADKTYSERKAFPSKVEYDHESLKEILSDSLGVLTFSEHILRTAIDFAGMPPKDADHLRKIIKGKNTKVFNEYKKVFVSGAIKKWKKTDPNIKDVALKVWKKFSKAGSYLFPRGHAASYALLGYICQYLKVHFPAEFFACHLRYATQEKYSEIRNIAKDVYGVRFNMPTITTPYLQFEASGDDIWWPIGALKQVGGKAAEAIIATAPYSSFNDFFTRVNKRVCNKRVMTNLILAGVFSPFGRKKSIFKEYLSLRGDKDGLPTVFSSKDLMTNAIEEIYGFEILPLEDLFRKKLSLYKDLMDKEAFTKTMAGQPVIIFGRVSKISRILTKNNEKMAFATIQNGSSEFEVTLFPQALEFVGDKFAKGNVLVVSGVKNIWNGKHSLVVEATNRARGKSFGLKGGSWVNQLT